MSLFQYYEISREGLANFSTIHKAQLYVSWEKLVMNSNFRQTLWSHRYVWMDFTAI